MRAGSCREAACTQSRQCLNGWVVVGCMQDQNVCQPPSGLYKGRICHDPVPS